MLKKFKLRVSILFLILENLYDSIARLFLQQQKFCIDLTSIFFYQSSVSFIKEIIQTRIIICDVSLNFKNNYIQKAINLHVKE